MYELLDHLRAGRTAPGGKHGATEKLAGAMVSLAAHADAERGGTAIPAALAAVAGGLRAAGLSDLASALGPLALEGALALPHLGAAGYHAAERRFAERMGGEFFGAELEDRGPVRAVMLTDTYDEINGVAGAMRRLSDFAARAQEAALIVVSCGAEPGEAPGHLAVRRLATLPVPAYGDAAWRLGVPPVRELIDLMERAEVQVVHAATPGPMGLAGLLLARVLGLPFVATYHTELGRYAMDLTGDRLAAGLTERAVSWFYDQAARVYVPSRATGRTLAAAGVEPERMALFTGGVDTGLFDPARRSAAMRRRLGGDGDGATVLLYVGRLSREKGLGLLVESFRRPSAERPDLTLALVGGGSDAEALGRALARTRHRLLGPLTGETLAAAYASADLFCLPSVTETLGQVVLEAGLGGLPAVVLDEGGASESIEHGWDRSGGAGRRPRRPRLELAAAGRLAPAAGQARALRPGGHARPPGVGPGLRRAGRELPDAAPGRAGPPPRARPDRVGGARVRVVDLTQWYGPRTGGIRTYLHAKARWAEAAGLGHAAVVSGAGAGEETVASSRFVRVRGVTPSRRGATAWCRGPPGCCAPSTRWSPRWWCCTTRWPIRARSPTGPGAGGSPWPWSATRTSPRPPRA